MEVLDGEVRALTGEGHHRMPLGQRPITETVKLNMEILLQRQGDAVPVCSRDLKAVGLRTLLLTKQLAWSFITHNQLLHIGDLMPQAQSCASLGKIKRKVRQTSYT